MMPITKAAPSRARTLVSSLYAVQLIGLCAMASSAPLMRRHSTAFAMVGFGPLRTPQPQLRHLRGGGLVPNPLSGACALITGAKRRVGQLAGRLGLRMTVDHDAEEILVSRIGLTSYGRRFPPCTSALSSDHKAQICPLLHVFTRAHLRDASVATGVCKWRVARGPQGLVCCRLLLLEGRLRSCFVAAIQHAI